MIHSNEKLRVRKSAVAQKVEDALRLRVGTGRRVSFASLADETGIKERTLRSYEEGAIPTLPGFLSLGAVLGPGFTSDVLGLAGQSARSGTGDEPQHMRLLCALTGMSAQIAEALEDDHVDHREAAAMRPIAQALIEMLEPLAREKPAVTSIKRGDTA